MTAPTGLAGVRRPWWRLHRASLMALAVVVIIAVGAAVLVNNVVRDQERRLRQERSAEVTALLSVSFASIESSLRVLGNVAAAPAAGPETFIAAATPLVQGAVVSVGVAEQEGDDVVVVGGAGTAVAGHALSPERKALAMRALAAKNMVTALINDGQQRYLILAVPSAGDRPLVTFQESAIQPVAPSEPAAGSPFSELRVALYASATPDPSHLLFTTETDAASFRAPGTGFAVGADQWFLRATSRQSLVGSVASGSPWFLLAGGLVTGLLLVAFVESLARRRSYALAVANERTTELRVALDHLDDARSSLEKLLDAGDAVAFLVHPGTGAIAYASPNIHRILGVSVVEASEPGFLATRVTPAGREIFERTLTHAAASPSEAEQVELLMRSGDDTERWMSVLAIRQDDDDGPDSAVLLYLRDIDARHRAQTDLQDREATLQAVFAASPDVVTIIDADDIVRSVSPAIGRVLGHPPDDGINVAVTDVVHPDDRAAMHDALARLRAEEVTHLTIRYQAYHRSGQWVVLESQAARLAGDDQARIVMITRDVSDRARLEQAQAEAREAAEVANRSKSEFVSRMSHELRTPLNAVLGFAQILELDELNPGQSEAVTQILKGGRHLLDLINEVLDISRIETGTLTLSPEAVFVTDLLAETLALVQPLADSNAISLHASGGGACDCYVFADRQRVKQVILNLLSNGLKYNRVGGAVTVSCVQTDDGPVRINIADTGPGIRPEHLPLLFTPFERLGAEQSGVEGTGIGLALSRHLAEAMGGMLGVTTSPGEGSTFWLELPRVEGPVERYERLNVGSGRDPLTSPSMHLRHTVLHIEDNLANLKLVERVLAKRGDIEVIPAMQGRLGLELAQQHHPIMVLLDLHLPDIGGDQVLEQLREDPATALIPVVIVSADATPRQAQRLLSAGAAAYVTKPIDLPEFLSVIDRILESSSARVAGGPEGRANGD